MVWKVGATVTSATRLGANMSKAVLIGQWTTDGLQAVMMGVDYYAEMDQVIKELIRDYLKRVDHESGGMIGIFAGLPGCHAEVRAVNNLFNKLEINPRSLSTKSIQIATYKTQSGNYQFTEHKACRNCQGILKDMNILTGVVDASN